MIVSNINELAPSSLNRSFRHLRREAIIILMRKGLFAQKALGPQGLTNACLAFAKWSQNARDVHNF